MTIDRDSDQDWSRQANGQLSADRRRRHGRNLGVADARAARELATDLSRADRRELLRSWRKPLQVIVADTDASVRIGPFRAQLAELTHLKRSASPDVGSLPGPGCRETKPGPPPF